ncbi:MAG: HPP family protein [Prosthecobacter sp.]|nr:HPP family protein [Prosthecobacter sp.]
MPLPTARHWLGIELIEVSLKEKLVATLGGGLALLMLVGITTQVLPGAGGTAVVASMGASAVLLYAVPHGALSQPWPVLGGHLLSAFIGVLCARSIDSPAWAAACAVGFAIGAMHHFRCIHPPGGATALTAVLGGTAIHDLGFHYVLMPVMANALAMVLLAVLINFVFPWRRYPAAFNRPAVAVPVHRPEDPPPPTHEEIVTALRSLDSFVDISEEDLLRLVEILPPHRTPAPSASAEPNRQ